MEIIFGISSVVIAILSIVFAITFARRTDKLVQTEDERAKVLIAEMNKGTQEILQRMQGTIDRIGLLIEEGNRRTQQMIETMNRQTQETLQHVANLLSVNR